jgi:transposase-like protein
VSIELAPEWSGYIMVDGDRIRVGKNGESLLVATDVETQDIPNALLAEHEDAVNYTRLLTALRDEIHYPFKGIVSDGDPAIESAIQEVCPHVPYQRCVKHFEGSMVHHLRYESSYGRGTWREVERFRQAVHYCLYAASLKQANFLLESIKQDQGFKRIQLDVAIARLQNAFTHLTEHFRTPQLPRTTNIVEGAIRRLDRKIDTTDGFEVQSSAWNTLKMLLIHYRFRKFTDSRIEGHNGHSPLQLAKVDTRGINWIEFSQIKSG